MPQKPTSKHYSSPASRSVSEASVSSPSSHELLSDVSIVACFQVPDKMPSSSLVSSPLAGDCRPRCFGGLLRFFWLSPAGYFQPNLDVFRSPAPE